MMASVMGGVGGISARSALTALAVRRGSVGAVNNAQNLPPHHLHIYMQGAERGAGVFILGAVKGAGGHGHGC